MGGVVGLVVLGLVTGELEAIVSVGSHHVALETHGAGLRDDVRASHGVVVRSVEQLGAGSLDLLQLGGVLGVVGGGGAFLVHHFEAELFGGLGEGLAHAGGVRIAGAVEHGHLLDLQVLGGEACSHLTLVGVLEAGAEQVIAGFDGVGGGGRGDGDQLGLVGQRGHGCGGGGNGRAGHGEHVVVAGELVVGVGGFGGVALVVHGLELDLLAVDAALGVDLGDRQLEALDLGLAVSGGGTGVGGHGADGDGVAGGLGTGAGGIIHAAAGAAREGQRHNRGRAGRNELSGELHVHPLPSSLGYFNIVHLSTNARDVRVRRSTHIIRIPQNYITRLVTVIHVSLIRCLSRTVITRPALNPQ